jgi:hypothetical protein
VRTFELSLPTFSYLLHDRATVDDRHVHCR